MAVPLRIVQPIGIGLVQIFEKSDRERSSTVKSRIGAMQTLNGFGHAVTTIAGVELLHRVSQD